MTSRSRLVNGLRGAACVAYYLKKIVVMFAPGLQSAVHGRMPSAAAQVSGSTKFGCAGEGGLAVCRATVGCRTSATVGVGQIQYKFGVLVAGFRITFICHPGSKRLTCHVVRIIGSLLKPSGEVHRRKNRAAVVVRCSEVQLVWHSAVPCEFSRAGCSGVRYQLPSQRKPRRRRTAASLWPAAKLAIFGAGEARPSVVKCAHRMIESGHRTRHCLPSPSTWSKAPRAHLLMWTPGASYSASVHSCCLE